MEIVEIIKVLILGVVEGITEWLPISSTGHMLLIDEFLKLDVSAEFREMFIVVIQLGAILSVVLVFFKKLWPFGRREKVYIKSDVVGVWLKVVVACIPAGVIGLLFDDYMTEHFQTPSVIAAMLIVYGLLFIVIERWNKSRSPRVGSMEELGYREALLIGLFQVLSLVPGTSRSGATIIGALLIGVSRVTAAEFTFYLAIPTMAGASLLKLLKFGLVFSGSELLILLLGMGVAFLVSLAVIRFLMAYVKNHDFAVFGWYRIALGLLVILYFGRLA